MESNATAYINDSLELKISRRVSLGAVGAQMSPLTVLQIVNCYLHSEAFPEYPTEEAIAPAIGSPSHGYFQST